jgi:hypothetical protein
LGIDLAIVAGDPTKTEEHPPNARNTEKQENGDRVSQCRSGLGMIENAYEADEPPKETKANWNPPQKERPAVPARVWWRSGLS